jgi:cell division protein FtsZ
MSRTTFIPAACRIKAIGVGGGGCNAVNRMVQAEIQGVEFIAANTDVQALNTSHAPVRVQIGEKVSGGLGVGGDPVRGRQAAEESVDELKEVINGAHMVFVAAGMGGGTGTGASPVIARLARESGALTVAIVTKPFGFEMARRTHVATEGISRLESEVDAMIMIPNDRILSITGDKVTVDRAFKSADDVLMTGVRAISEVVTVPGLINLDFADLTAVLKDAGQCWLSIGYGSQQDRVVDAARAAVSSDLLEVPIDGARGVLYVVSGAPNLTLAEVSQAASVVRAAIDPEATVIFGVTVDPALGNDVRVTLVATGFTPVKAVAEARRDEDFHNLVTELESDETRLEAPAFMRRPVALRMMSTRK